ncbi:MAG TPA: hypothetical protein VN726_15160 [Hanamia sp.]|jgi:hypothetical protein|nr:hypothetical protein [Hanamia sp.]
MTIISSQEIILDNQKFRFEIYPYEFKNSLGRTVAFLQEYVISNCDGEVKQSFRLYKTKEGNWYEIDSENSKPDKIIRELKSAINSIETGFESVIS